MSDPVGGRIEGRVSADGNFYETVQADRVLTRIPLSAAADKLRAAIRRNSWEPLP